MQHLAWAREEKDMSQEDLAYILNRHRTYVSDIENGLVEPNEDELILITETLGYEVEDLL